MKFKITMLIFLVTLAAFSQTTNKGKPRSWKMESLQKPQEIVLPAVSNTTLLEQDRENTAKAEPLRFAYEFATNYTMENSGQWNTLPDGRLWMCHFVSKNAKAMHFWFKDFYIPHGAMLYVYNSSRTELLGAYDEHQNGSGSYFGTWPVTGDDVWLEYYEPAAEAGNGRLPICRIGHAYRELRSMERTGQETFSAGCNYDVECFVEGIENRKDVTKRSVTRIIGSTDTGAFLASGALINTTANDGTPYVLSANHAWVEGAMYTFRFNWINPEPACPSNINGDEAINEVQTMSGATLKARREESDFMLLELNNDIPLEWGVRWSGWNRTETPPPFTYGVHHPGGDIMKVCLDESPPILVNDAGFVWSVDSWEIGTTEGGSSGSPLLDPEGRILGQLWYGASGCNGELPNGYADGYGRLSVSWDAGETPETRLMEWLDPLGTGAETIGAYPDTEIYGTDAKCTLADLGHDGCTETIHPQVRLINYGTEPLTTAQISYSLNWGDTQTISWEGSLDENNAVMISLPPLTGVIGNNALHVWVSSLNGVEDENPANDVIEAAFTAQEVIYTQQVTLSLVTDNYAAEISWDLKNEYGNTLYSMPQNSYENSQTYTTSFYLDEGCYTFTIHDGYGDGICCSQGQGSYTLIVPSSGAVIAQGGDYGSIDIVHMRLQPALGTDNIVKPAIAIYPNPSAGIYTIEGINAGDTYEVYNMLGQHVAGGSFAAPATAQVSLGSAANGVYLLKLQDKATGAAATFKLVKE